MDTQARLWAADDRRGASVTGVSDSAGGGHRGAPRRRRGTLATTAFFNVAFRHSEPWPEIFDPSTLASPAWWRDKQQAAALAEGDLSPFFAWRGSG